MKCVNDVCRYRVWETLINSIGGHMYKIEHVWATGKRNGAFHLFANRAGTLIRAGLPRYSSHRVHTVALLSASIRCVKRGLCCWCDEMIEWCPSLLLMRIICAVTKLVHTIARLSIEHFFKRAAIKCRCSLQHVYCSARCPELLLCAQGEAVVFSQHLKNRLQMCLGAWVQSVYNHLWKRIMN